MSARTAPADRPPLTMPKPAIAALIELYLLLGSVPAIGLGVLAAALGLAGDPVGDNLLLYVGMVGGWLLALLFVVRSGRRIGLHLLRATALLVAAALVATLIGAALLAAGLVGDGSHHARLAGQFGLIAGLVCAPVLGLLLRALARVRWLDPASSPDEWEPPARRAA